MVESELPLRYGPHRLLTPSSEPHTYYATFLAGEWNGLHVQRGDLVIDAGANIGDFTVRAARAVGPSGLVLAIEPSPVSRRILEFNIRSNRLGNVVVAGAALAGSAGSKWIRRTGTYAVEVAEQEPGAERVRAAPPLDLMHEAGLSRADVIKMDIEGAEEAVFRDLDWLEGTREVGLETHSLRTEAAAVGAFQGLGFDVTHYTFADSARNAIAASFSHPLSLIGAEIRTKGYASRRMLKLAGGHQDIPALRVDTGVRILYARRRQRSSFEVRSE